MHSFGSIFRSQSTLRRFSLKKHIISGIYNSVVLKLGSVNDRSISYPNLIYLRSKFDIGRPHL